MLYSISFSKSIEIIKRFAFCHCDNLEEINFPEDSELRIIEEYAFFRKKLYDDGLIFFPPKLKYIGDNAFQFEACDISYTQIEYLGSDENAEEIYLPDTIKHFQFNGYSCEVDIDPGNYYTKTRYSIYSVAQNSLVARIVSKSFIRRGTEKVLQKAFLGSPITHICFPASIKIIEKSAFANSDLRRVSFSKNSQLTIIEDKAFKECYGLKYFRIPSSLEKIGKEVFFETHLISLSFPKDSKIKSIGPRSINAYQKNLVFPVGFDSFNPNCLFYDRTTKKRIPKLELLNPKYTYGPGNTIYDGTTLVFAYQSNETVDIREDTEIIGENACCDISIGSLEIPNKVKVIKKKAFMRSFIMEFNLPNSLEIIERKAFSMMSTPFLEIPESVTSLAPDAFYDTNSELIIPDKFTGFSCYEKRKNVLNIHNSIEVHLHPYDRFYYITKVIFPKSVKKISYFSVNKSSYEIVFSEPSQLEYIGKKAFNFCGTNELVFPQSLKVIESSFNNCLLIERIYFPKGSKIERITNSFREFKGSITCEKRLLKVLGKFPVDFFEFLD